MSEIAYETTPYAVEKRGRRWAVVQKWWGRDISLHATEMEADAACVEEARRQGCLVAVRPRPAKRKAAKG